MMEKTGGKVSLCDSEVTIVHNRIKIDKRDFLIVFNMAKDNEKK